MKKFFEIIWYYFSYPIRLFYKDRVSIYENILYRFKINNNVFVKSRRVGFTDTVTEHFFYDIYCETYMQGFINKWKIK